MDDSRWARLKAELARSTDLRAPGRVDWPKVAQLAADLLAENPLDLRAATYWAGSLAHTRGLRGLAQGASLLERLIAREWPRLEPLPRKRLGFIEWWASQAVKSLAYSSPWSGPSYWENRRLQKSLARLEIALDELAPGQDLKIGPLRVAIAAKYQKRLKYFRRRFMRVAFSLLGFLALVIFLTLGLLAESPPSPSPTYKPCLATGPGRVRSFSARYESPGRLWVFLDVDGSLGSAQVVNDLQSRKPVLALDFPSLWPPSLERLTLTPGLSLIWGQHQGFSRLSINLAPKAARQKAPMAQTEVFCQSLPWGTRGVIKIDFS